jgi:hypothetical protein
MRGWYAHGTKITFANASERLRTIALKPLISAHSGSEKREHGTAVP